jgi:hypothetical protein
MKISVFKLKSGWFARPHGSCGTCGWSPFAWDLTQGRNATNAFHNFIIRHNITDTCEMIIE